MAGGDHGRRGTPLASEERDARGGEHTGEDDVGTLGTDARDQRGFEHRSGSAGVAADDERLPGAEHPDRGAAERGDELDGELGVRDPTHAIRAETQSHGDAIKGRATASSTAEPCGPS